MGINQRDAGGDDDGVPVPNDASNILVFDDGCTETLCPALLTVAPPSEEDLILVSWDGHIDAMLDRWRVESDGQPARMLAVSVGEIARSTVTAPPQPGGPTGSYRTPHAASPVTIRSIENPADLTQVGILLTSFLDDRVDHDRKVVVCMDSLTALLEEVPLERAFQFLHILTVKFSREGAYAHFHLDRDAHDEQTIETLKQLFDATIECCDGDWTIRQR